MSPDQFIVRYHISVVYNYTQRAATFKLINALVYVNHRLSR